MNLDTQRLDWKKNDGLLPAIVQHADTGAVLMLGYMSPQSLRQTLDCGRVTFFSRSRQELWTKGETSGNFLELADICSDCDSDALLVRARPAGPVCHRGTDNCFDVADHAFLTTLQQVIAARATAADEASYTARLLAAGTKAVAQKVGEEAVEVALAATSGDKDELLDESADLVYHLLVLLADQGVTLTDVSERLRSRHHAGNA
ncbi:MAG: bifunctional phosphoribosyl-AMP cyclohydrolase/phosphoribosyl-ATP diphosphatase HisIE [Gammaproteobacteria bacterium]|nr:bifunctional phosphoribosyl-AMP cyclohydrolase/phosphoribosyl-ATP diphosphatase HisIE [Gammaproteobacteria bacterium]NNF62302.1 bifunctional phosphoribosyl-AMP cyclohydrolase/phosphoribosyl-ATP diphosphatase HisIE [Gammaproteobacteria bacterium]NNM21217.1 bifunctional phosphoribosyl-AMP cyclohydrolase/phosphoribosyl-ATP diphosphatase HisIE [Gammaproteobacteria bacterium]